MTIIFLFAFIYLLFQQVGHSKAAKPAKAVRTPVRAAAQPVAPRTSIKRRIMIALYGDKSLVVELRRYDGDKIQYRTSVRVKWMNSATCHAKEGYLPYCQFQMVLEDGKRLSLPITEKDGKRWVTYQGQQYNHWDSAVHVRRGLLDVLQGNSAPVFG